MSEVKQRLISLDLFRGATIAAMILVNNPGSWGNVYPPFLHASWHGCTPTDLVFPFFLFIVGVSIVLAYTKQLSKGADRRQLMKKILKRVVILFILGLILSGFPFFDLTTIRIPGVLQRIAVVFLVCAPLYLYTKLNTQIFIGAGLLVFYWVIMMFVPVPGVGEATLEVGKNMAAYIDSLLLSGHMWSVTKTWDPEGVLSTLPSIATCISGMLAGYLIKSELSKERKVIWLFLGGGLFIITGLFWDMHFPINKSLWTSSFVLYTAGVAAQCLAACYFIVDILGHKKWAQPFVIYGSNAITVFFLSGIFARLLGLIKVPFQGDTISLHGMMFQLLDSFLPSKVASLAWALICVYLFYLLALMMYRKKIFIKV